MLILASRSPRREALLRATGLPFQVVPPEREDPLPGRACSYPAIVRALALRKAASVAARVEGVVLGADTIVVCERTLLGKPADAGQARDMLHFLSGRRHWVYTWLALVAGDRVRQSHERTAVTVRVLTDGEIARYVDTGEPLDKAGAYAIQGVGGGLISHIRGCYTNVIGLPLPRLLAMLCQFAEGRPDLLRPDVGEG
jgi:septum formation protein